MTERRTDEEIFELADDPLMATGEKWFILRARTITVRIRSSPARADALPMMNRSSDARLMIAVDQETGAVNAKSQGERG